LLYENEGMKDNGNGNGNWLAEKKERKIKDLYWKVHVLFKALNWVLKTIKNHGKCALNHNCDAYTWKTIWAQKCLTNYKCNQLKCDL
jgi:hypothetical protein